MGILNRKEKKKPISDASIAVLMLGARRTGKSSMLASMLDSMERQSMESGLCFTPDKSTAILMERKKANLEKIFELHKGEELFSTVMDNDFTLSPDHFVFSINRLEKKGLLGDNTGLTVDFIDPRGEDLNDDDSQICEMMAGTAIWMIAIDTPALMEDNVINSVVNKPTLLYSRITSAYEQDKKLRLVLFIPLKCEKYYHSGRLDEVNARIKEQYKNVFAFFEAHNEFTVAISPILTMGDVVFDHYQRTEKGGYAKIDGGEEGSTLGMQHIYNALFRFCDENGHYPCFSPLYCEQPLYYVLAYFLSSFEKLRKLTAKKNIWDIIRFLIEPLGYVLVVFERTKKMLSDKETRKALENTVSKLKSEGDGYEIVFDGIGMKSFLEGTEK